MFEWEKTANPGMEYHQLFGFLAAFQPYVGNFQGRRGDLFWAEIVILDDLSSQFSPTFGYAKLECPAIL